MADTPIACASIVPVGPHAITGHVDTFSAGLTKYLTEVGLPSDNVLVSVQERGNVLTNLPTVCAELAAEDRIRAMYISKYVAACGAGLFDAALNYLWDETVRNLREKVARFDLAYFYDAVITDTRRRSQFSTEADLPNLQDWELIKGCRDTGMITDIGFRHLDYIRDMRNHASAAHPNQTDLSGFQLISWLQTCIREVLSKAPTGAVIEVGRLLRSIREQALTTATTGPVGQAMQKLPAEVAVSLLRTLFGMYSDPRQDTQVKTNIRLVAAFLWAVVDNAYRYDIGLRHASYSANAEVEKAALAHEFLETVGGLAFLSPDVLTLELSNHLDALLAAHNGFNNFYTEVPIAHTLKTYIPGNGQAPESLIQKFVKVLTMCRIGNGYGVSHGAEPVYTELMQRWQDRELKVFATLVCDVDVASRLQIQICAMNYKTLAQGFIERSANPALRTLLKYVSEFPIANISKLCAVAEFKKLAHAVA